MATLNTTLRFKADVGSEKTSVVYTVDKTITEGGLQKRKITGTSKGAGITIVPTATIAAGTYVIVRNMDNTKGNYIYLAVGTTSDFIKLAGGAGGSGDFAIFPAAMGADIKAWATSGTEILEYATYEV